MNLTQEAMITARAESAHMERGKRQSVGAWERGRVRTWKE